MLCFKFEQNHTINELFDFFEGQGEREEEGDFHFKIVLWIIIGKHMKMFLFKFNQNRTITKNYFFEGGMGEGGGGARRGTPILNFIRIYYW